MKNSRFTASGIYVVLLLTLVMSCRDSNNSDNFQPEPKKGKGARAATMSGFDVTIYNVTPQVTEFYDNFSQSGYCYTCGPASTSQITFPIDRWFNYMGNEYDYPFTSTQKEYIEKHPDLIPDVDRHVRFNGTFVDANLVAYMDIYLEDEYQFITSPGERTILNQRSGLDQIVFRSNAIYASAEAVARTGQLNCQDNKCNAYRHAYFNALNAQSFTIAVARNLGQAREDGLMINSTTLQPSNFTCIQPPNANANASNYMDLFNNEWGYRAFTEKQQTGGILSAIVWKMSEENKLLNAPQCP